MTLEEITNGIDMLAEGFMVKAAADHPNPDEKEMCYRRGVYFGMRKAAQLIREAVTEAPSGVIS